MKLKLKKICFVASLLPFVISLCAIEMGGCSTPNCLYTTEDAANKAVKDANDAAIAAEQAAKEAEDAVPDDCADCNLLKQRVSKLDNELDVAMQAVREAE